MSNIRDTSTRPPTEPLEDKPHSRSFPKVELNEHVPKRKRESRPVWLILYTYYLPELTNVLRSINQLRNITNITVKLKLISESAERNIFGN